MSLRWLHTRSRPVAERLDALKALSGVADDGLRRSHHYTQTDAIDKAKPKPKSFREWAARYDPRRKTA